MITLCRAKVMGAVVTEVRHRYWASLEVDKAILSKAGMRNFEKVLVVNMANGQRFETYLVEAEEGSGQIVLAGGGAYLGNIGDDLGFAVFSIVEETAAEGWRVRVVVLEDGNGIKEAYDEDGLSRASRKL